MAGSATKLLGNRDRYGALLAVALTLAVAVLLDSFAATRGLSRLLVAPEESAQSARGE